MNIICSPSGIVNPFRPEQGVTDISNAGFENISLEFDMCCSAYELENYGTERINKDDSGYPEGWDIRSVLRHPEEIGRFYENLISSIRAKDIKSPLARSPYLPRDTKRPDLKELLLRLAEESIRFCGKIGCRYITVRPLEKTREQNRECYLRLVAAAKENDVTILLENQCRSVNGHMVRGVCSGGFEAAQWIDELNQEAGEERFGFCMDVGVCSLCGQDMHEFAAILGDRIKAVILRDCDGQSEGAMLPFTSTYCGHPQTDWLNLIRGLREIGFDGQLVLDIRDTAAAFSPLLRPQLMILAKATAEYFKWQIEIENLLKKYTSIVLFGAGNMCRNYIKCYGEKYPPLFTCDNNRKAWGTAFCGIEVKSPEALKELPDNCGVFICNIYYHEIERQLKDMGIENIEFFNDEYMPSFYFDRLKMV